MKNVTSNFLIILSVICVFISCSKDNESISQDQPENNSALLEEAKSGTMTYGQFHNYILEKAYSSSFDWSQATANQVEDEIEDLIVLNAYLEYNIDSADVKTVLDWQFADHDTDSLILTLSNQVLADCYSDILNSIDLSRDYRDFSSTLNTIRNSVANSLSQSELETVDVIIDISKNSFYYWEKNEADWEAKAISNNAKRVIAGDVAGAINGAIGAAIATAGVGTLLGACLGAPAGSILAAVTLFIW